LEGNQQDCDVNVKDKDVKPLVQQESVSTSGALPQGKEHQSWTPQGVKRLDGFRLDEVMVWKSLQVLLVCREQYEMWE
jgi:hypothetical protein